MFCNSDGDNEGALRGNAAEGVAENGKSRLERGEDFPLQEYYKQYQQDFFDFIIIDECHRVGEFFDKEKTYDETDFYQGRIKIRIRKP